MASPLFLLYAAGIYGLYSWYWSARRARAAENSLLCR